MRIRAFLSKLLSRTFLRKTWVRLIFLVAMFFFLTFMFVSPTVKYAEDKTARDAAYRKEATERSAKRESHLSSVGLKTEELIKMELQKAIDEIKLRLEEQNSWYHYKFILIGGLFAIFLGQSSSLIGRFSPPAAKPAKRSFIDVLTSTSNYAILTLAVVIALGLDMHIRNNMFGNQTLGLWIANYVEPAYPYDPSFIPWETFIRQVNTPPVPFDWLYKLGFSIQLHFMTMAAYLVYAIVFQQICVTFDKQRSEGRKQIVLFGFLLVHLSALTFVFVTRAVSGAYLMNLIPTTNRYANGWGSIGYYVLPLIGLIVLSAPYLRLLRNEKRKEPAISPADSEGEHDETEQR